MDLFGVRARICAYSDGSDKGKQGGVNGERAGRRSEEGQPRGPFERWRRVVVLDEASAPEEPIFELRDVPRTEVPGTDERKSSR
jgi:hypothetical protein